MIIIIFPLVILRSQICTVQHFKENRSFSLTFFLSYVPLIKIRGGTKLKKLRSKSRGNVSMSKKTKIKQVEFNFRVFERANYETGTQKLSLKKFPADDY